MKIKFTIFIILVLNILCEEFPGLDVSKYQKEIDWTTVSQNNHFAIIRAGSEFGHLD